MTISEIKNNAKTKLKGNYIKCFLSTLLYFIVILTFTFIERAIILNIPNELTVILIESIFAILSLIFGYGILANILDITSVKTLAITDFINITIKHATKNIKIMLSILVKLLIPILLFLLSGFYLVGTSLSNINNKQFLCFYPNLLTLAIIIFIITTFVLFYFLLKYVLSQFIYYENNNLNPKKIIEISNNLMKYKKAKYILLMLSFIPWLLAISIIIVILSNFLEVTPFVIFFYSMLKPYITVSQFIFYEDCKDEK